MALRVGRLFGLLLLFVLSGPPPARADWVRDRIDDLQEKLREGLREPTPDNGDAAPAFPFAGSPEDPLAAFRPRPVPLPSFPPGFPDLPPGFTGGGLEDSFGRFLPTRLPLPPECMLDFAEPASSLDLQVRQGVGLQYISPVAANAPDRASAPRSTCTRWRAAARISGGGFNLRRMGESLRRLRFEAGFDYEISHWGLLDRWSITPGFRLKTGISDMPLLLALLEAAPSSNLLFQIETTLDTAHLAAAPGVLGKVTVTF